MTHKIYKKFIEKYPHYKGKPWNIEETPQGLAIIIFLDEAGSRREPMSPEVKKAITDFSRNYIDPILEKLDNN